MLRKIGLCLLLLIACSGLAAAGQSRAETADPAKLALIALMQPQQLADLLSKPKQPAPMVIYVGYHSLFVGAHIRGAIFAGPDSKPEGIDQLKDLVHNVPREHAIIVYCGYCPFEKCPNVRPAYGALQQLGFRNVKVLLLPTNLHTDWVAKAYPTDKGAGS